MKPKTVGFLVRESLQSPGAREMSENTWRGHLIECVNDVWIYVDTQNRVDSDPNRPCGHCGLANTPEGHDGCLGTLPGVMNACCGHGSSRDAYVQFIDGTSVHGEQAFRQWAKREASQ